LKAFGATNENKSGVYSYVERTVDLPEPYEPLLKKNNAAWRFFETESAYYRRAVFWWIVSAKKEETRMKRLQQLVACSAKCERAPEFKPRK